ncbi:GNAT family N-acetyltransferase [Streptosporangium sp. KLBMP 9127]|nr:GNAT family N-acetyltransferase [Streptosporangium sp. KLBMP 9127]
MPPTLITKRLLLRPPVAEDFAELLPIFTDPEAMRFIGPGDVYDEAKVREGLQRRISRTGEQGLVFYTIVHREDDRVIGDCGLQVWESGEIEIGWRMAAAYWGQGYASEAAAEVFRNARDDLGLTHLICMVQEDNTASWRIAERLGFRLDRTETWFGDRLVRIYVWDAQPG